MAMSTARGRIEGLPEGFPMYKDWRISKGGVLNPVKDQKKCNMCWAIVAAEAVAAGLRLVGGKETVVEMASQELLDCCKEHETECYTYSLKKAFKWIKENGICKEGDYPFLAKKCMCRPKGESVAAELIKGIAEVNSLDTVELLKVVLRQPVAGCIEITNELRELKGEIYEGSLNYKLTPEGKSCKHAILIVGFGFDEKEQKHYWLIKNSWGTGWGIHGYARIAMESTIPDKPSLLSRTCYPIFGSQPSISTLYQANPGREFQDPRESIYCKPLEENPRSRFAQYKMLISLNQNVSSIRWAPV